MKIEVTEKNCVQIAHVTANVNEIMRELCDYPETSVAGAVYHTDTGAVEFLDC